MENFFTVLAFVSGLAVGSFLNVVIYRLPIMLESFWKKQAQLMLGLSVEEQKATFNLAFPPSSCPHCKAKIRFYENIPVFSYLIQKGRCRHCVHKISLQYPLVELLTAFVFAYLYYRFSLSYALLGTVVLSSSLIALMFIDFNTQLLPDIITLPLLWCGLLFNLLSVYNVSLQEAVLGAIVGYLFFWVIFQLFKLLTGKEGMGYGDFKLFAALGAWFGIVNLPVLLFLSSVIGLIFAAVLKVSRSQPMPFGPAIAIAGLLLFMFYPEVTNLFNQGF